MTQLVDERVEIRDLGVSDVVSLVECVRRCYGESYAESDFYDPASLRGELCAGRLLSVGALEGGRVVGHIGARVEPAGGGIAETVGGIVDPDFRGTGLTRRIGARLVERYRAAGIAATIHLATGAHDRTQRLIVASGGVATGVLLGYLAAGTDYHGIAHGFGDARQGVVVYTQIDAGLDALDVHVPVSYADRVRDLYRQLGLDRGVSSGPDPEVALEPVDVSVAHDERRGISRLRFGVGLGDGARPAFDVVSEALCSCQEVVYADVPIADARGAGLLELLGEFGFFFGALLPGGADSERIRVQRIGRAPIAPDAIVTASAAGSSLLAWIVGQQ